MQTIGQILRSARETKKLSLKRLENITKIKSFFIESIERGKWEKLPPFPTVLGFVKSLAGTLGVNEAAAVAVLKRDYPPKNLAINPKPDISSKFVWSPKVTFVIGLGVTLAIIFGYLIFQYIGFISPPSLVVDSPKDGQSVSGNVVTVFGTTETDARITVNNQPVLVDENGKFSSSIEISEGTKEIVIKSISRSGKETVIMRKIESK